MADSIFHPEFPVPDERDQITVPHIPDLRCREHEAHQDLLHALLDRVIKLESRVANLERRCP